MLRTASIPMELIEPPGRHPRRRSTGQLVLRPAVEHGGYQVVAGHRTYEAAARVGAVRVCCMVREDDPADPLELLAEIRGLGGRDPLEEARAFDDAMRRLGVGQRQLAALTGIGQSHISKRVSLLMLSPRDQALVRDGRITIDEGRRRARALAS